MNRISLHKKHFCIPIRAFIYSPWAYLYTSILKIDIRGALTRQNAGHALLEAGRRKTAALPQRRRPGKGKALKNPKFSLRVLRGRAPEANNVRGRRFGAISARYAAGSTRSYSPSGSRSSDRKSTRLNSSHYQQSRMPYHDRKSTRLNSSHYQQSRMPSSA